MGRSNNYIMLICLSFIIIVTGCWDRNELNDISVVSGMALHKGTEERLRLSVEAINAKQIYEGESEGGAPAIVYGIEGNTIAELVDKMNVGYTRRPIFSHIQTVVIDEELAREGVGEFFQYLERNAEFRNDFKIIIAHGVKAEDMISTTYPIQKVPSLKLSIQIDTMEEEWGGEPKVRLTDFIRAITTSGRHPVTAAMTIDGDPNKGQNVGHIQNLRPEPIVIVDGIAVFNNDKLVGYLNNGDTRNYLWTQDEIKFTTLSVPCSENKFIGIRVKNSSTKIKTSYTDNKPKITVDILLEAVLQSSQCADDLTSIETYRKYQEFIDNYIEEEIKGTVQKVQQTYGIDIFGFGNTFHRQHPRKFKEIKANWDDEFTKAEIDVVTSVYIRRAGIRTDGFLDKVDN
ncbi:Ger(x)C family spore germination protein [Alkalihalobacterium elongatum]|uniref:Ger(x)C family spore germination protein n=1 Tax=Alkalihalobacterium elongatum TaxID=2675466 RepID=UPI001C1FC0BA|nr:Ger(x)C family spore germination protein [Alkalihalobacterium elongatum]